MDELVTTCTYYIFIVLPYLELLGEFHFRYLTEPDGMYFLASRKSRNQGNDEEVGMGLRFAAGLVQALMAITYPTILVLTTLFWVDRMVEDETDQLAELTNRETTLLLGRFHIYLFQVLTYIGIQAFFCEFK